MNCQPCGAEMPITAAYCDGCGTSPLRPSRAVINATALASVAVGAAGWLSWLIATPLAFIIGLVGVIAGHIARHQIHGSDGLEHGDAFAFGGLALSYLLVLGSGTVMALVGGLRFLATSAN